MLSGFFAGINALLVLVKITHSIVNYLITQAFEIKWLEKLNAEMLNRWLDHKNYYLLRYQKELPDNIDQRIEQDASAFISGTVSAVKGVLNAIVATIEFTIIFMGIVRGIDAVWLGNFKRCCLFYLYFYSCCNRSFSLDRSSTDSFEF